MLASLSTCFVSLATLENATSSVSIIGIIKWIIIIAACVGILYVALTVFKVQIPYWVVQIFWIVVVAAVALIAINFIASL